MEMLLGGIDGDPDLIATDAEIFTFTWLPISKEWPSLIMKNQTWWNSFHAPGYPGD